MFPVAERSLIAERQQMLLAQKPSTPSDTVMTDRVCLQVETANISACTLSHHSYF
jgi:hypothetical protein